jgi:hypothetical protein
MKKLLSIVSAVAISAVTLTACSNNSGALSAEQQLQAYKDSIKMAADTAGLSEFRQWKAYNELSSAQPYQDMAYAPVAASPVARSYASAPRRSYSSSARRSSGYSSSRSRGYSGGGYSNSTASYPAKKRGWSKAAKGAVIGGAGGAIAGAVINKKNRAVGAVVGGIIGGGGGYVIGRQMDKRDGRY